MHADNTLRGEGNPLSDVVVKREVRQLNSLDPMRIFFYFNSDSPRNSHQQPNKRRHMYTSKFMAHEWQPCVATSKLQEV